MFNKVILIGSLTKRAVAIAELQAALVKQGAYLRVAAKQTGAEAPDSI